MKLPPTHPGKTRIGLALGGGSARGWAHIGVIRGLQAAGIEPDIVCGTSIGAPRENDLPFHAKRKTAWRRSTPTKAVFPAIARLSVS